MSEPGIYIITNTESGKVYVGSSVDLRRRQAQHRSRLQRGKHDNSHLQRAWDKYGAGAFRFMVCEYVEGKGQLMAREQYWLDFHRLLTEVYNHGLVARHPMLGYKHTDETRAKMSAPRKPRPPHSEETRARMSANSARKGQPGTFLGHTHTPESIAKMVKARGKPYPAFYNTETGEVIPAGVNLAAMCREHGLAQGCMQKVVRKERSTHKGWVISERNRR